MQNKILPLHSIPQWRENLNLMGVLQPWFFKMFSKLKVCSFLLSVKIVHFEAFVIFGQCCQMHRFVKNQRPNLGSGFYPGLCQIIKRLKTCCQQYLASLFKWSIYIISLIVDVEVRNCNFMNFLFCKIVEVSDQFQKIKIRILTNFEMQKFEFRSEIYFQNCLQLVFENDSLIFNLAK